MALMAGNPPEPPVEEVETIEPTRVLIGSPIGRLAIEFQETIVTRVIIQPSRSEAQHYKSLDKIELTDFLLEALGRFSEHLAGLRTSVELDIDLGPSGVTGLTKRVLKETCRVPYGRTWTYSRIAEVSGRPGGYRLVQAALAINPIPILIPCHRVVPSKGGVGAYIGGTKKKEKLLRIEARSQG